MNTTVSNTDKRCSLFFRSGLLALAATALSSCCFAPTCTVCNGNGYVLLEGGAPVPADSKPAAAEERIEGCPECDTTGKAWAVGSPREKKDIDRSKLKTLRVY